MFKLVLIIVAVSVVHVQSFGAWKPINNTNGLPEIVERVARWSLASMNENIIENGSDGFHAQIVAIKNVFSQLVAGTNYKFSMDTIYSESSKYTVRCNILVNTYFIYCYI